MHSWLEHCIADVCPSERVSHLEACDVYLSLTDVSFDLPVKCALSFYPPSQLTYSLLGDTWRQYKYPTPHCLASTDDSYMIWTLPQCLQNNGWFQYPIHIYQWALICYSKKELTPLTLVCLFIININWWTPFFQWFIINYLTILFLKLLKMGQLGPLQADDSCVLVTCSHLFLFFLPF